MAKSSNTAVKKLLVKSKVNWMRQNLGTCKRMSPRGFNHGMQTGLVDREIEPGKVVTGDADRRGVYRRFERRAFNKWAKYGA